MARTHFRTDTARQAPEGTKWCPDCERYLSFDCFLRGNYNNADFCSTYCRPCENLRRRVHRLGTTVEHFKQMMVEQNGECKICGLVFDVEARPREVDIDHCHETGFIRGLLCSRCNRGLQVFYDRPELLEAAAMYLRVNQSASMVDASFMKGATHVHGSLQHPEGRGTLR